MINFGCRFKQKSARNGFMSQRITRFAPSPTGLLHAGHAASALLAFDWAQKSGAEFLLRIEDIDQTRCKPEFTKAIFEDLHWLGLHWPQPVWIQSTHMADYAGALEILGEQGLLYPCFLTRKQVMAEITRAPHNRGQVYRGPDQPRNAGQEKQQIKSGKPFAWRLSLSRARQKLGTAWDELHWQETGAGPKGETGRIAARPELLGDVILARKEILTSYHLSVTLDDAAQGITHVIRGKDLFESTHVHVLLQALLGLPTPIYHHHGILRDEEGIRLAKRGGALSLRALRESGMTPDQVREQARL
jgi:glutamyl-Q tRNA(Asp) synthetase